MRIARSLLAVTALVTLPFMVGCSSSPMSSTSAAVPNLFGGEDRANPSFNAQLGDFYHFVAELEDGDPTDLSDARILRERSIAASRGNVVMPLTAEEIRIVRADPAALALGRERLIRVLNNPAVMQQQTTAVAQAQVSYDCWALHQQAEPNASHNAYRCDKNFQSLINRLDVPEPEPAPVAVQPAPRLVIYDVLSTHTVSFGWDDASLSAAERAKLDELKQSIAASGGPIKRVALKAYADRSGAADYNQRLSERRLKAVSDYLGMSTVDMAQVDMQAFGETNLPVPTADGVREAANRVTVFAVVQEKQGTTTQPQPRDNLPMDNQSQLQSPNQTSGLSEQDSLRNPANAIEPAAGATTNGMGSNMGNGMSNEMGNEMGNGMNAPSAY
jgi:OmpA-OmpF porin, OOP family